MPFVLGKLFKIFVCKKFKTMCKLKPELSQISAVYIKINVVIVYGSLKLRVYIMRCNRVRIVGPDGLSRPFQM